MDIHYGFEHHLKWLSPQIVHYLLFEGIGGDFGYSQSVRLSDAECLFTLTPLTNV